MLIALSLALGLYRDEIKALVFLPCVLSMIGLILTVAGGLRCRRLTIAGVFALLFNGSIVVATGVMLYLLFKLWRAA